VSEDNDIKDVNGMEVKLLALLAVVLVRNE
jgi:hypothetical protein